MAEGNYPMVSQFQDFTAQTAGLPPAGSSPAGLIEVKKLRKSFPQNEGDAIIVLNDVDLTFEPGEFISLIGPSGCGKSTLLRIIAGLTPADSGDLTLDGDPVTGPGFERGLVFQDPTLFPWMTIYENIAYGLRSRGIYKTEKHHIPEYFRLVGLEGFEKSYPHHLSGGMAQRAALARTLVNKPKVLLLDEPLGALDAFTRMNMQDEILKIWEEHRMTTVMVTHDVDEAIYMATRIVVMSARPAKIEQVIKVELGRPRRRDDPEFLMLRAKILKLLHFAGGGSEPEYIL
jgi:ABC-type nitrate/sulfonate/bicarbonate transport system ATPase subunit